MKRKILCAVLAAVLCIGMTASVAMAAASSESGDDNPGAAVSINIAVSGDGELCRQTPEGDWEAITPGDGALSCQPGYGVVIRATGAEGFLPTSFVVDGTELYPYSITKEGSFYSFAAGDLSAMDVDVTFQETEAIRVTIGNEGTLAVAPGISETAEDMTFSVESGAALPASADEYTWTVYPQAGYGAKSVSLGGSELETSVIQYGYVFTTPPEASGDLVIAFEQAWAQMTLSVVGEGSVQMRNDDETWESLSADGEPIDVPVFSTLELRARGDVGYLPLAYAVNDTEVSPSRYTPEGACVMCPVQAEAVRVSIIFQETQGLYVSITGPGSLGISTELDDQSVQQSETENAAIVPAFDDDADWYAKADMNSVLKSLVLNTEPLSFSSPEDGYYSFTIPAGSAGQLEAVFEASAPGIALSAEAPDYVALESIGNPAAEYLTGLTATTADLAPRAEAFATWFIAPDDSAPVVTLPGGEPAPAEAVVGTGMTATFGTGEAAIQVIAIVKGDVLGTGLLNISQLTRLAKAVNGSEPLEGPELAAADLSGDGTVNISDLVSEARMLSGASQDQ